MPNPSIFGLEMTEWTRKAPFCPNFSNSFEPICKHIEPKSRHVGLEGALLLTQALSPSFYIKCNFKWLHHWSQHKFCLFCLNRWIGSREDGIRDSVWRLNTAQSHQDAYQNYAKLLLLRPTYGKELKTGSKIGTILLCMWQYIVAWFTMDSQGGFSTKHHSA